MKKTILGCVSCLYNNGYECSFCFIDNNKEKNVDNKIKIKYNKDIIKNKNKGD